VLLNCAKVRPRTDQAENCSSSSSSNSIGSNSSNLIKKERKTAATLADNWAPSTRQLLTEPLTWTWTCRHGDIVKDTTSQAGSWAD